MEGREGSGQGERRREEQDREEVWGGGEGWEEDGGREIGEHAKKEGDKEEEVEGDQEAKRGR